MTKCKIIITCQLLLLFVFVKISFSNQPQETTIPQIAFKAKNLTPDTLQILSKPPVRLLSFANESMPLGNERIDNTMKKVLRANSFHKLQTHKLHHKAHKWFSVIEPVLEKYGIPQDFKYIPLVESGLTTNLYSPRGAAGLWQFMPQTGRDFGLKVNGEIDERFNIKLSTVAAAKYFKSLYKIFGNWTLVAAAYNGGEGRIKKQMRTQKQANYFKLKLNRETAKYVYSIISMKEIIEHPEKHGYKLRNSKYLAYQR